MDFTLSVAQIGPMFFSAYCDKAGSEVLLGPDNLVDLADGPFGIELHYRCHCGDKGVIYPKLAGAPARCA